MAYHWTNKECTLGFGDARKVVVGETLSVPDPTRAVICCCYGMHSSERVVDALKYAPGCTLFEVSHPSGVVQEQHDKQVGPDRKADYCYGDLTDIVVVFAKWCAARAKRHAAADAAVDAAHVRAAAARAAAARAAADAADAAAYAAATDAAAAYAAADADATATRFDARVYAAYAARAAATRFDARVYAAYAARAAADAAERAAQEQWWEDCLAAYKNCEGV